MGGSCRGAPGRREEPLDHQPCIAAGDGGGPGSSRPWKPLTAAAAERAAVEEPAGLGTGGDRLLARAGRPTGPSPVDRARPGSKHHLVVDGQSIPLAVSLTGGNHNDVTQLEPLLDKIPAVAGQIGRPRRGPDALLADRGYDHDEYPACSGSEEFAP
ncbi:IS4/IS5 family transposase [Streptomyces sp. SHP22-7]|nr:IS4/IS5 family transposase [Streptomyces sp. SHP22-7]